MSFAGWFPFADWFPGAWEQMVRQLGDRRTTRAVARWSGGWRDAALDLVFPPVCVDCGSGIDLAAGHRHLCAECVQLLCRDADLPTCLGCALPRHPQLPRKTPCWECRRRKFRFHEAFALGIYRGHLRQVAIRMKQFPEFSLTTAVGHLLADRLDHSMGGDRPDVIVPIPKYWVKRMLRGANTSEVLAETLSQRWRRPLLSRALRCRKPTRKQSLLGRSDRQRNLAGALQCRKRYDFSKADVLIVDDIMTTGATANEAARALAQAGARRIRLAVVARATHGRELPFLGNRALKQESPESPAAINVERLPGCD